MKLLHFYRHKKAQEVTKIISQLAQLVGEGPDRRGKENTKELTANPDVA